MHKSPLVILIIGLVVAFFLILLTSGLNMDYVPYNSKSNAYYSYEPMVEYLDEEHIPEEVDENFESENENDLEHVQENFEPENEHEHEQEHEQENFEPENEHEQEHEQENFEPIIDVPQTVNYGPFRDSEIIDKFSQVTTNGVEGVNGCISSGLSNAGGYICLTPELVKLLKSRGGNATCN